MADFTFGLRFLHDFRYGMWYLFFSKCGMRYLKKERSCETACYNPAVDISELQLMDLETISTWW